jgi:NitT/TauT family transport system ATP-binding protein
LLLDEPFSQLDFFSQRHLESVLLTAWNQHKPTVVLVSHDLEEAVFLSDRIAVFSKQPGRIVQVFDNPLPRPRQESHRFSRVFQNLKQRILHAVRDEK